MPDETDKYYKTLGLNPGASEAEVKEAYRDLAKVWHPDRFPNDPRLKAKANERLREIINAYKKLESYFSEEAKRDNTSNEESHTETQPPPDESPPAAEQNKTTQTDAENPNFYYGIRLARSYWLGQDLYGVIHVNSWEALYGCQKTVSIREGLQNRSLTVTIPARVWEGTCLRLKGLGKQVFDGSGGDLYLEVKII